MTNFFKNKKVLVAGGAGFIGTNLILKLLEHGAKVNATIHKKPPQIKNKKVKFIKADLTKASDCKKVVKGMDYVFMCAANTSGAAVMATTPLVHVTPNIMMNSLILEAAYEAQVEKFLFISSNTVYPVSDNPVKETDMEYGNLYEKYYFVAWMKQFSEVLCEMYTRINNPMQTVIVRPANIYGHYCEFDWKTSHVIPALIRKVVERHKPLEVWGDGKDIKDFIYIDDFIQGLLLAMEKINEFDPINIASGKECTIREILQDLLEIDDYKDAKVVYNTSKPSMIPIRLIDNRKAKKKLGFEAKTGLKEGLKRTVEWYRKSLK